MLMITPNHPGLFTPNTEAQRTQRTAMYEREWVGSQSGNSRPGHDTNRLSGNKLPVLLFSVPSVSAVPPCWVEIDLNSFPVEFGFAAGSEDFQCAVFADGIGAIENPVLPGGQASEDARFHGLGAGEAEVGFHAGQRIGRQVGAFLDRDAHFLIPVDVVRGERHQAQFERGVRTDSVSDLRLR